jgi:hypothetical protein
MGGTALGVLKFKWGITRRWALRVHLRYAPAYTREQEPLGMAAPDCHLGEGRCPSLPALWGDVRIGEESLSIAYC